MHAKAEHIGRRAKCKCGHVFVIEEPALEPELVESPKGAVEEEAPPPIPVETDHKPEEEKGFWATAKGAAKAAAERGKARMKCSDCGARLGLWENGTGLGGCAKCVLPGAGLLEDRGEPLIFWQVANYREGIADHNRQSKKNGYIYVCRDHLCFIDVEVRWAVAWERVLDADLDIFKPGTVQSMLAGLNSMVLRQIRSALAVTYFNEVGVRRTARFNIHGAVTVYGDQDKATELVGHVNTFRPRFAGAGPPAAQQVDVGALIEKLASLRERGILSDEEFQKKKAELLSRL
jgi:hypothetical protein